MFESLRLRQKTRQCLWTQLICFTEQHCLKILKVRSIVLKLNIVFSQSTARLEKFLTKFSPNIKLYQELFLPFNNWKQEVIGSIILNQGENTFLKAYLWLRFMLMSITCIYYSATILVMGQKVRYLMFT